MFANGFTAFVDACVLASALKRNLLLTLAEAELFRVRWSETVLAETQKAIASILVAKGLDDGVQRAARARHYMESAFEEALVIDFDDFGRVCVGLPDPSDVHVVAAALKAHASVIVTDNVKHFPKAILGPLNLEARSSDAFIADTFALDYRTAVDAIRAMRLRLTKPAKSPEALLLDIKAAGLTETVEILRPFASSL